MLCEHAYSFQLQLQMLSIAYTDDFSGPGIAVDPVCVYVFRGNNFLTKLHLPWIFPFWISLTLSMPCSKMKEGHSFIREKCFSGRCDLKRAPLIHLCDSGAL